MKRRLAAILAADIVGFSRLMGADEDGTLDALADLRRRIVEPAVLNEAGKVIKRTGDGWLVEFASARDAVTCATIIQKLLAKDELALELRIGVHLGDIIFADDGDIYGDGVNVAARLESIAVAGGIAISDQVFSALDSNHSTEFLKGGERSLKNIARPIRVWHWPELPKSDAPQGPPGSNALPVFLLTPLTLAGDIDAAADLALDVLSGLQDAMASRSGIRVAMASEADARPTYSLQGRCRIAGNRCRLHLSITVAATGETCWSTKIDGDISDTFAFVDDVIWQVSAAIRVQVNAHAGEAYAALPDDQLSGQQLLSKAAYLMHLFDPVSMDRARNTMATAVDRDPENAIALAMYSFTLMQEVTMATKTVHDLDVEKIIDIADKAVQFGPRVDYAFHNRARIRLWLRRDHEGCRQDALSALDINSGFHFAHEDLALADIFGTDVAKGVDGLSNIIDKFPTHPTSSYRLSILAIGYALLGDRQTALEKARKAYESKPDVRLHALAYAAAASGNTAITNTAAFSEIVVRHALSCRDAQRFPFADSGQTSALSEILLSASLPAE